MTARHRLATAGRLQEGAPLAPLTTYRFGGPARFLVEAHSEVDLEDAADLAREEGLAPVVLGRGSNVVVSDRGFDGMVVRLAGEFLDHRIDDAGVVHAGGAVALPVLARSAARAGRTGLEFYVGIPGTVGGAVRMNAGCHGSDTAGWLLDARVFSLGDAAVRQETARTLGLTYRHSGLDTTDVVVLARFRTEPGTPADAEARIREITRWRKETQPGGTLNAGSVFKNPPGDTAGRIIDHVGLKGLRIGGVEVSRRHANFFVADPGATAADVHALVFEVRRRVLAETGVELEPELRFIGDFS
ncbi:MAG: UDP-N-acetylmuramate dehydrogenase [Acidimicrobiia bacterium]|nr:UDP-N-acetylmuramate dehydrogenase [Acidimicrobiia bacterium]